jgi:hypothetical protein
MADTAISALTTAGTPSGSAVGVIADGGVDYKISLANFVKAGGSVILSPVSQQTGTINVSGVITSGSSTFGPTSMLLIGTATLGTASKVVISDDGTNALFTAAAAGSVILGANAGGKTATLGTAGNLTLSAGNFVTGSTSIANGASTINGALAIVGALTGATTINAAGIITGLSFTGSGAGLTAGSVPNAALVTGAVTNVTASGNMASSGGLTPAITITATPSFTSVTLSTALAIASGGTGSTTQNFVDLSSNQTIGGTKTFSGTVNIPATGITAGTLNIGAGGAQTGVLPIANGGTGALSLAASPFAVLNPASIQTGALKVSLTVQSSTSFTFNTGNSIFSPTSLTLASGVIVSAGTGTYSSFAGAIAGDSVAQRSATSGYRWWGGATANASIDFGGTTGGVLTASAPLNVTGAINSSANIAAAGTVSMAYSFMRNKIINGQMWIDQRNSFVSGTALGVYTIDRWFYNATQASKGTWQGIANIIPTAIGPSSTYALSFTSSSAYSVLAADKWVLQQAIESNNIAEFGFGTAYAKAITLSFYVYLNASGVIGTYGGSIQNYAQTRSYPFTYSIPAVTTWTKISITIPGDTAGTWVNYGTSGGMWLNLAMACGTTQSGTANTWASVNYLSATGASSVVATNGALIMFTNVQLETGSVATQFEQRLYGTELALCQRYFCKSYDIGSPVGFIGADGIAQQYIPVSSSAYNPSFPITFPVSMRVMPSMTMWNPNTGAAGSGYDYTGGASWSSAAFYNFGTSGGMVACLTGSIAVNHGIGFHWTASAEL